MHSTPSIHRTVFSFKPTSVFKTNMLSGAFYSLQHPLYFARNLKTIKPRNNNNASEQPFTMLKVILSKNQTHMKVNIVIDEQQTTNDSPVFRYFNVYLIYLLFPDR